MSVSLCGLSCLSALASVLVLDSSPASATRKYIYSLLDQQEELGSVVDPDIAAELVFKACHLLRSALNARGGEERGHF